MPLVYLMAIKNLRRRKHVLATAAILSAGSLLIFQNCQNSFNAFDTTSMVSANGTPHPVDGQNPNPPIQEGGGLETLDPGFGTGTWRPPGAVNFWVVDQAGPGVQSNSTYAPGCINGTVDGIAICQTKLSSSSPYGEITLALGNILSIRYRVHDTYQEGQYFQVMSGGGSGISYPMEATLTESPGDFQPHLAACSVKGIKLATPRLVIGEGLNQCPLKTNKIYYFNIRTLGHVPCTMGCNFRINEPLSISY